MDGIVVGRYWNTVELNICKRLSITGADGNTDS